MICSHFLKHGTWCSGFSDLTSLYSVASYIQNDRKSQYFLKTKYTYTYRNYQNETLVKLAFAKRRKPITSDGQHYSKM